MSEVVPSSLSVGWFDSTVFRQVNASEFLMSYITLVSACELKHVILWFSI
jgi:hypothetical protein